MKNYTSSLPARSVVVAVVYAIVCTRTQVRVAPRCGPSHSSASRARATDRQPVVSAAALGPARGVLRGRRKVGRVRARGDSHPRSPPLAHLVASASRVYLGVHYPSDCVAGAFLAAQPPPSVGRAVTVPPHQAWSLAWRRVCSGRSPWRGRTASAAPAVTSPGTWHSLPGRPAGGRRCIAPVCLRASLFIPLCKVRRGPSDRPRPQPPPPLRASPPRSTSHDSPPPTLPRATRFPSSPTHSAPAATAGRAHSRRCRPSPRPRT